MVGDSEEELWTEAPNLLLRQPSWHLWPQERTEAVPLARHIPSFLCHGQRQRGHQVLHLAEANNSHALKGLVAVAGRVQILGHLGLAALSMRHKSTLGARLRKCNLFSTSTDAVWAWCPGHR